MIFRVSDEESAVVASRKWNSIEEMPVNLMKEIVKAFGIKGISQLDRDDLTKQIKQILQDHSLR